MRLYACAESGFVPSTQHQTLLSQQRLGPPQVSRMFLWVPSLDEHGTLLQGIIQIEDTAGRGYTGRLGWGKREDAAQRSAAAEIWEWQPEEVPCYSVGYSRYCMPSGFKPNLV